MVLELVVRQLLGLGVVALGDELQVRRAALVAGEAHLVDGPAHRLAVLERRERVAEPDRVSVGAEPAERAGFLGALGVAEDEPVAGRLGERALAVDPVDDPATAAKDDQVALLQRVVGDVRHGVLVSGAGADGELVAETGRHGSNSNAAAAR